MTQDSAAMECTLLGTDAVISISKITPYPTALCGTQLIKHRIDQINLQSYFSF